MMDEKPSESAQRNGATPTPAERPRLLIIGAPAFATKALQDALRTHFDVTVAAPADAERALCAGSFAATLSETGGFHAIERSEATLQTNAILNAIGEAVCVCDGSGRVAWANTAFERIDEVSRAVVVEMCRRRLSGEDRAPARRQRFSSADGTRWYEALVTDLPGGGGAERRVVGAMRDVTDVQRTNQKIDALDRAGAELVRLEADTVRKMHVHDRLEFLRAKIVRLAHEILQFDHFVIWLIEPETNKLEQVISTGLSPEVQSIQLYAMRENNGISGYVAATGRSYICHDAAQDPRYIQGLDAPGSSLTVPLLMNDKVIGAFNIESNRVGAFTEDDRHFAEIFARHVALALHMLNLLVVERVETGASMSSLMQGELSEPLNDLAVEAEWLKEQAAIADPEVARHVDRIISDVDSIRKRMREVARGPRSILGVERELSRERKDPLLDGKRVLIADDEPEIRDLIRDVLRNRGAHPVVCASGQDAIDRLRHDARQRASDPDAQPFALIVSDIKMPDRNGYEVFSEARKHVEGAPVILMTGFGYDPHHSIVRASQEGLQCVLFKPFQVDKLLEEVHKALGQAVDKA